MRNADDETKPEIDQNQARQASARQGQPNDIDNNAADDQQHLLPKAE